MTTLAGIPSYLVGYIRASLVWSSIQRPTKSVMLQMRGEENQNNMSAQITLTGALKLWRLLQF